MSKEVQGKEGKKNKKASVSDSRYYSLLNERKKKKVSANNNRRGEKKDNILRSWTATRGEEHV